MNKCDKILVSYTHLVEILHGFRYTVMDDISNIRFVNTHPKGNSSDNSLKKHHYVKYIAHVMKYTRCYVLVHCPMSYLILIFHPFAVNFTPQLSRQLSVVRCNTKASLA